MLTKILQGPFEKRNGYYYEYDMHSMPIGEGGMGVVYKGFKVNEVTGNRMAVAIKAMNVGLPAEVYERAEREASIRLHNDNLVLMLGFISSVESDPYGKQITRYYVISEYLNGVVLSDVLSGQFKDKDGIEIPYAKQLFTKYMSDREETSLDIIKRILSGILALHDKGYIHRDIDPTNIMVTSDGAIKLIDFGIAKYVRSLTTIDNSLTSTGKFIGKPEFASPELVLGDVRNQGYQTDIYAIGILFYRLLVGKLPFTGSKYEVLQMQLNAKVPVRNINNKVIRKIVKKATEKNKEDRYSSVAELRVDIDNISNSTPYRLNKKMFFSTLGSAAVVTGIIVGILILPRPDDSGPTPEPVEPVEIAVEFEEAMRKLNSDDGTIAKEGLVIMQQIAADNNNENYVKAACQLGITYCPFTKVHSSEIKERREVLALNDSTSAKLSMHYLERVGKHDSISVDALYVLGYSYWKQHEWTKGAEVLEKAKVRLESSSESLNGFSQGELKRNIHHYLNLCEVECSKIKH